MDAESISDELAKAFLPFVFGVLTIISLAFALGRFNPPPIENQGWLNLAGFTLTIFVYLSKEFSKNEKFEE